VYKRVERTPVGHARNTFLAQGLERDAEAKLDTVEDLKAGNRTR
jgi:hypothetical protein